MELNDIKKKYSSIFSVHPDFYNDFKIITSYVLDIDIDDWSIFKKVDEKQAKKIDKYIVQHLKKNVPIQKIVGGTLFYDVFIPYSKHTLTPRMETELLVEKVLEEIGDRQLDVLDLCCGSGCIGIAIANKSNANVVCSDYSKEAIKDTFVNAMSNGVYIRVVWSDMFQGINSKFDIIVSNPPYISESEYKTLDRLVKKNDPKMALVAQDNGLSYYKIIANQAHTFLNDGGKLFLEIGYRQGEDVVDMLDENFEDIRLIKDYSGNDRIIVATKKKEKQNVR